MAFNGRTVLSKPDDGPDRIYTMTFVSKWLIGLCFEEQCETINREYHNHI